MKKLVFSAGIAAFFSVAFMASSKEANAQYFQTGAGCPSANVYYANGYSNNYCVPSYYPGFVGPVAPTTYTGTPFFHGGYNGGYNNQPVFQPRYNPFQPPVFNQPFYPYTPVPTYYYPPAPRHNWHWNRGY